MAPTVTRTVLVFIAAACRLCWNIPTEVDDLVWHRAVDPAGIAAATAEIQTTSCVAAVTSRSCNHAVHACMGAACTDCTHVRHWTAKHQRRVCHHAVMLRHNHHRGRGTGELANALTCALFSVVLLRTLRIRLCLIRTQSPVTDVSLLALAMPWQSRHAGL